MSTNLKTSIDVWNKEVLIMVFFIPMFCSSGTTSPSTGFGPQSSPLDSSHSTGLRPFLGCMIMMTLLVSGRLVIWSLDNLYLYTILHAGVERQ